MKNFNCTYRESALFDTFKEIHNIINQLKENTNALPLSFDSSNFTKKQLKTLFEKIFIDLNFKQLFTFVRINPTTEIFQNHFHDLVSALLIAFTELLKRLEKINFKSDDLLQVKFEQLVLDKIEQLHGGLILLFENLVNNKSLTEEYRNTTNDLMEKFANFHENLIKKIATQHQNYLQKVFDQIIVQINKFNPNSEMDIINFYNHIVYFKKLYSHTTPKVILKSEIPVNILVNLKNIKKSLYFRYTSDFAEGFNTLVNLIFDWNALQVKQMLRIWNEETLSYIHNKLTQELTNLQNRHQDHSVNGIIEKKISAFRTAVESIKLQQYKINQVLHDHGCLYEDKLNQRFIRKQLCKTCQILDSLEKDTESHCTDDIKVQGFMSFVIYLKSMIQEKLGIKTKSHAAVSGLTCSLNDRLRDSSQKTYDGSRKLLADLWQLVISNKPQNTSEITPEELKCPVSTSNMDWQPKQPAKSSKFFSPSENKKALPQIPNEKLSVIEKHGSTSTAVLSKIRTTTKLGK